MKHWRYQGPDKKVVLDDGVDLVPLNDVFQKIMSAVPKKLGPAAVEFHVIEAVRAYPTVEMGIGFDRLAGDFQADIIVDRNRGDGPASRLADFIGGAVNKNVSHGIRFGEVVVGEGHEFRDEKWRIQVSCPWHVDILSARN